jgi:hypothetical protein
MRQSPSRTQRSPIHAAKIAELVEKLGELEKVIEEWKRGHRIRGKRRRKRKGGESSSKKKPGRKAGHDGAFREPPNRAPDRIEKHSKKHCNACSGATLRPTGRTKEQLVEELVPEHVELIRH